MSSLLYGAIVVGVALRFVSAIQISVGFDANYYVVMGASFSQRGEFLVPWGDPSVPGLALSYSHHMSPLWPIVLGSAIAFFGYSVALIKSVSFVVSVMVLAVAYECSRSLYGKSCALATTSIFALFPELILDVGRGYSENLTMIFFILTIWGILKSLTNRRYILLGGLFAGLVFLSRASAGYFFVIAGMAGLVWRYSFLGRAVLRDHSYLGAIGIFLSIVAGWSVRNLVRFGFPHWETDAYLTSYTSIAISVPSQYLPLVLLTMLLFCVMLLSFGIYFGPEVIESWRSIRSETESGLWLAILLVPFIAAFVASIFAMFEVNGQSALSIDRIRYIVYAFFPLVLVGTRRLDLSSEVPHRRSGNPFNFRFSKRRFYAIGACAGGLVFSFAAGTIWLIPLFSLGFLAVFTGRVSTRISLLLLALLVVSAEVGTSSTVTAEQLAVDFVVGRNPSAIVAFDGSPELFYNLTVYVMGTLLRLTDIANESTADFVISSNSSGRFPGMTAIARFSDRSSQGVVQSVLFGFFGRPTVIYESPLTVYSRS